MRLAPLLGGHKQFVVPYFQREPCLPHPSRPDEGDEAMFRQQAREVAQLFVATHEGCQRLGDRRAGLRARHRPRTGDNRYTWRTGAGQRPPRAAPQNWSSYLLPAPTGAPLCDVQQTKGEYQGDWQPQHNHPYDGGKYKRGCGCRHGHQNENSDRTIS